MVLIVYDVPDDKRRLKLSKLLERYGTRVQYSVFECFITPQEMHQLHQRVQRMVKPPEDNVRFYWLTSSSLKRMLTIGSLPPEAPPNAYIF